MATIRTYTTIEQSRKLAEILPIESADGFWEYHDKWCSEGDEWEGYEDYPRAEPYFEYTHKENEWKEDKSDVPCWSLASLFGVLPKEIVCDKGIVYLEFHVWENSLEYVNNANYTLYVTKSYDNSVDACYEMIIRLNELNLLWLWTKTRRC